MTPAPRRKPKPDAKRAAFILERIYLLLEQYLNAVENSLAGEQTSQPQTRERDARMLNALARTLEKLFALEKIFLAQPNSHNARQHGESLQKQIERRISALLDAPDARQIPQKPLR